MATRRNSRGQFTSKRTRRRTKSSLSSPQRRRSKPKGIPVVATALTINQLDALSKATFGMPLYNFLFDKAGSNSTFSDNSWEVSLSEILNGYRNTQHSSWQSRPFTDVIKYNLKLNGTSAIAQVIAGNIAVSVLKKTGVFRYLNKANQMLGVDKSLRWN